MTLLTLFFKKKYEIRIREPLDKISQAEVVAIQMVKSFPEFKFSKPIDEEELEESGPSPGANPQNSSSSSSGNPQPASKQNSSQPAGGDIVDQLDKASLAQKRPITRQLAATVLDIDV